MLIGVEKHAALVVMRVFVECERTIWHPCEILFVLVP
jgi:hypothetical protein